MKAHSVRMALALAFALCASSGFADNCDNKCRMRKYFYVCPSGGTGGFYWKYAEHDCFQCVRFAGLTGGGMCEKYGDWTDTTCTPSGTNTRQKHSDGNLRCDCDDASKWFIESFEPTGPLNDPVACDRYVCPGIAIPISINP